jgi:hypothetical protein
MTLLLLLACKAPEPAPSDLDGLAHYFWQKYDAGADEELAEAVRKLDAALGPLSTEQLGAADAYLSEPLTYTLSDLTKEEAERVLPGDDRDPSLARGFVMINPLPCTMTQAERFVYAQDQMALYPDAYSAYARTYSTDLGAYEAREAPFLDWDVSLTATTVGITYTEELGGGIRYVPALDAEQSPWGWFSVNRAWLHEPACFGEDCDSQDARFDQDFQLEVHYERADTTVVHAYFVWREAEYFGISQDDDALVNLQTDGFIDWDEDTAALCEEERRR